MSEIIKICKEYNNKLYLEIDITFEQYLEHIYKIYYNKKDISFINYLDELALKDEFNYCVEFNKLYDFGIIDNDITPINFMKDNNLKYGDDFVIKTNIYTGNKEYRLNPYSFKLIILKNDYYANYYILLETVCKFYKKYKTKCLL